MFGRKKPAGMDIKSLRALDRKPVKYVTERDGETFRELKVGGEGAINVSDSEFSVVCGGVDAVRCPIGEVSVSELMNKSGLTVKYTDPKSGKDRSLIVYYSDGAVSLDRKR